jgi:hypothetical protein
MVVSDLDGFGHGSFRLRRLGLIDVVLLLSLLRLDNATQWYETDERSVFIRPSAMAPFVALVIAAAAARS